MLVTSASTGEMLLQVVFGSVRSFFLRPHDETLAKIRLGSRHRLRLRLCVQVIHSEGTFTFLLCCTTASLIALCCFLLFLYVQHVHRSSRAGLKLPLRTPAAAADKIL